MVQQQAAAVKKMSDIEAQAASLGIPFLEAMPENVDKAVLTIIPEDAARKYRMTAFQREGDTLCVAMVDPQDFEAFNVLRFLAEKEHLGIDIFLVSEKVFDEMVKAYTGTDRVLKEAILSLKKEDQVVEVNKEKKQSTNTGIFQDAPIAKLVEVIVKHAIEGHASDIHIEPIDGNFRARFRVDGLLRSDLVFPKDVGRAVISRIKILSNLKIDESRKPQDGRFRFEVNNDDYVDLRVSSLPVMEGEKIVMRVLEKNGNAGDLENLGLWGRNRSILEKKIREPFGIILITGPTGSGKSTSLYSFLQILNKEDRNIITLEDPVEYYMDGINQSQVRPEIGYTFANGLRSVLRQDPNVIMVGEIRDGETAELAIHAALTGHLVLSTLHTNDAIGAIPRLVDMGIEPFLLSSSMQAVAAQRLVRRICGACKEEQLISDVQTARVKELFQAIPKQEIEAYGLKEKMKLVFFRGKGCGKCNKTGYKGRIALYETIDVDDTMHTVIADQHGNEGAVKAAAVAQGMLSMKQDGLLKVLKGITTLSEIERVTEGVILIDEE